MQEELIPIELKVGESFEIDNIIVTRIEDKDYERIKNMNTRATQNIGSWSYWKSDRIQDDTIRFNQSFKYDWFKVWVRNYDYNNIGMSVDNPFNQCILGAYSIPEGSYELSSRGSNIIGTYKLNFWSPYSYLDLDTSIRTASTEGELWN